MPLNNSSRLVTLEISHSPIILYEFPVVASFDAEKIGQVPLPDSLKQDPTADVKAAVLAGAKAASALLTKTMKSRKIQYKY